MPTITPFRAIRPRRDLAHRIAALPYDVYDREEAQRIVSREPLSFLRIDRAETTLPPEVDQYDPQVYTQARALLDEMMVKGDFLREARDCYYIYELTMDGHVQSGIVACSQVADYQNDIIKKHEETRPDKLKDRINHINATDAHTGPIFLTYRAQAEIDGIVDAQKTAAPEYDFHSEDGVRHRVWVVDGAHGIRSICTAFAQVPLSYIADGHHRTASAVGVGLRRRAQNPHHLGNEEYMRFLSVLFPHDQLKIMPYNRVVADLCKHSVDEFVATVKKQGFLLEYVGKAPVAPEKKGIFGMYLDNGWYRLQATDRLYGNGILNRLDVSILQNHLLGPVLNIGDPRTDRRLECVGGIRGLSELERKVSGNVAFSLYPTAMDELLGVADAGLLMPPKSTWFEPKLRSGLFIHALDGSCLK